MNSNNNDQPYSNLVYNALLPYPNIEVSGPNEDYARLLKEDYTGVFSELTSTCQYEYHYMTIAEENAQVAQHLLRIAQVELRHLEMIGGLLIKLGHYPIYHIGENFDKGYWSGVNVIYGRNMDEQLKADLETEYSIIRNYNTQIKMIEDQKITAVLERIVEDEKVHVQMLQCLIRGDC